MNNMKGGETIGIKRENMSNIIKNKNEINCPPYKCKVCSMGDIKNSYDICPYCGWEADDIQNEKPDYMGGANEMSLNQYKKFWGENKEDILANLKNNRFYAIEKSQEYFDKFFK